jgi:hypothetical protein
LFPIIVLYNIHCVCYYGRRFQSQEVLLFTEDGAANAAPDLLTRVFDGGRFQLYRVGKARTAQSSNRGMPRTRVDE